MMKECPPGQSDREGWKEWENGILEHNAEQQDIYLNNYTK